MNTLTKLSAALLLTLTATMAQAEIAVIVNPANADTLSDADIKKLFLGMSIQFPGGGSATPLNLPADDPGRDQFNDKVLNKSSQQLKSYWSKLIFTGKGKPPQEAGSNAEMISKVSSDTSAIGYIDASAVTPEVKVIGTF